MNILILSDDIKTRKTTGANIRLLKLIRYISREYKDLSFDIYTPYINKNNIIKLPNTYIHYVKSRNYLYIINTFSESNNVLKKVIWKILTYPNTTDYLWIKQALSNIIKNKDKKKYDLILLQVPSYLNVIYGSILKNKLKIPLIYDLRDDLINFKNIVGIKFIEKMMVKNTDRIVCVTEGSLNKLSNKYMQYKNKFDYIPNGFDYSDVINLRKSQERAFFKNNSINIVYAGAITKTRLIIIYKIIDVMDDLIEQKIIDADDINFHFFPGCPENVNKRWIHHHQSLTNRGQYQQMLKEADILISVNYNTPYSIPGKLYEFLAVSPNVWHFDNCIVCNEVMSLFSDSRLYLDSEMLRFKNDFIQFFKKRKDEKSDHIVNKLYQPPSDFIKKYSRKEIARNYEKIFRSVL